jgi:hypothetical protein
MTEPEIRTNWRSWLHRYVFVGLEAVYHSTGLARPDRPAERRGPVALWMSAAAPRSWPEETPEQPRCVDRSATEEEEDGCGGIAAAALTVYRLYGVGDEIDLNVAEQCLADSTSGRAALSGARQSQSIQIAQPPLRCDLGRLAGSLGGLSLQGRLRASIYDLGVVVLAWESRVDSATTWGAISDALASATELPAPLADHFHTALSDVERLLRPAISRPQRSEIVEDYSVLVVERLRDACPDTSALAGMPAIWGAALGERHPLSASAAGLVTSMSYYPEDLALLSWNSTILVDPDPLAAATAADLLEFAEVELLVLRIYDSQLDAQLPAMYRQMTHAERRLRLPFVGVRRELHRVQRLVAEVVEITERVDNALKVTDDVYWNRLYTAALGVLRVDVWRTGVEHKLALLRETYNMLRAEAESEREIFLEVTIVLLILVEVVLAWPRMSP